MVVNLSEFRSMKNKSTEVADKVVNSAEVGEVVVPQVEVSKSNFNHSVFDSLDNVISEYIRELKAYNKSETTINARYHAIKKIFLQLDVKTISDLKIFEDYLTFTKYVEICKNNGIKKSSININRSHLIDFIKFCVRHKLLTKNIVKDTNRFSVQFEHTKYLPKEEIQVILDYLKDELEKAKANPKTYKATLKKLTIRYYTILLLATTGIRANECISIRMSDVNIDSGSIDIRGKGYEGEVSRKVYLPSNIKEAFIEYLSCDLFESDREYLFPALRGYKNSITTQTINVWLNEVGDELGLKLHPHLFRHSYATNKIQSNPNSLETISKVLGHKSSTITSKYYIGENKEDIQSLMQIEDYK